MGEVNEYWRKEVRSWVLGVGCLVLGVWCWVFGVGCLVKDMADKGNYN